MRATSTPLILNRSSVLISVFIGCNGRLENPCRVSRKTEISFYFSKITMNKMIRRRRRMMILMSALMTRNWWMSLCGVCLLEQWPFDLLFRVAENLIKRKKWTCLGDINWDEQGRFSSEIWMCAITARAKTISMRRISFYTFRYAWIYYSINQSVDLPYIKSRMKDRQSCQRLKSDRSEIEGEKQRASCRARLHAQHDRCFLLSISVEEHVDALIENLMDKQEEISLIKVEWLLNGSFLVCLRNLLEKQFVRPRECHPDAIEHAEWSALDPIPE